MVIKSKRSLSFFICKMRILKSLPLRVGRGIKWGDQYSTGAGWAEQAPRHAVAVQPLSSRIDTLLP